MHMMYMQKHSLLTVHSYSTHLPLGDATRSLLPCAALFSKIQVVVRGNVRCQRLRAVNSVTQSDHSRMHVHSEPCALFLKHLEFENTQKISRGPKKSHVRVLFCSSADVG